MVSICSQATSQDGFLSMLRIFPFLSWRNLGEYEMEFATEYVMS